MTRIVGKGGRVIGGGGGRFIGVLLGDKRLDCIWWYRLHCVSNKHNECLVKAHADIVSVL